MVNKTNEKRTANKTERVVRTYTKKGNIIVDEEQKSDIGGMVTFGEGLFDSTVVPFGVLVASFTSGFRNAWTKSGKNKPHAEPWTNAFYRQPTGTEEQKLGLFYGRTAARVMGGLGETTGYFVGAFPAAAYGAGKEAVRAARTRSDKVYQVDPKNIPQN